jgi:hypothetical protein
MAAVLVLACAVSLVWLHRRDPAVLAVLVAPLFMTWAGFSLLARPLNEHYWYVSVAPCAALTVVLGAWSLVRGRYVHAATILLLAGVLVWMPFRVAAAWSTAPFPQYGALVRGSRAIRARAPEVRAIVTPFLPPSSDPVFVYEILGGRLSSSATFIAIIDHDGTVTFRAER